MDLLSTINSNLTLSGIQEDDAPQSYLLNEDLIGAVNIAIASGKPLLITGEPGTGKTQLAHKIAYELNQMDKTFLPKPLVFFTKTTSTAQELFYHYDALAHFQQANIQRQSGDSEKPKFQFISLQALGKAIALTNNGYANYQELFKPTEHTNSVVLIDEIDKAPRDFPNDILNEIDKNEFFIKEADNFRIKKHVKGKVLVIMTSNSEKNLPDPFLRRCIFYNINFPGPKELLEIMKLKMGVLSPHKLKILIKHFLEIRKAVQQKKPATAELVTWIKILELSSFLNKNVDLDFDLLSDREKQLLEISYSAIVKSREDMELIKRKFLSKYE
ncbi:MAG: MoxR family ATPase [Bacteroidota bacterium]